MGVLAESARPSPPVRFSTDSQHSFRGYSSLFGKTSPAPRRPYSVAVSSIACRDGWKCDVGSEIELVMVVSAQAMGVLQTQGTGSARFPRYTNSTNGRYQTQMIPPYISIFFNNSETSS